MGILTAIGNIIAAHSNDPVQKPDVLGDYRWPSSKVPMDDWVPYNVINPQPGGPWICGGAARRWMADCTVGGADIDVYFANQEQIKDLQDRLTKTCASHIMTTENAITYQLFDRELSWKIQLIKAHTGNSVKEILKRFDLTVCQIGFDGQEYHHDLQTLYDVNNNILRFTDGATCSIKRYAKYIAYGFVPAPGTHTRVMEASAVTNWEINSHMDDYNDM